MIFHLQDLNNYFIYLILNVVFYNETKFFKIYGLSGNYIKKKYFSPSYNWDISLKSSNLDKSTVPPVIKQHTFLPLISLEYLSNTDTDSALKNNRKNKIFEKKY